MPGIDTSSSPDDFPGLDRGVDPTAGDPAADLADTLRKAETENVRRMGQADVARAHKYAIERFASDLLSVRDALEQTLATENATTEQLREGVELTLRTLTSALDKQSITTIDPLGEKFDPNRHQAMTMVPSSKPAQTVVQVFQKGYLLNDRVLRPALVAVSSGPDEAGRAA